ncbi:hypothetical protein ACSBR1_027874 [Camellia fascicularis]
MFIQEVVEILFRKLIRTYSSVVKDLVGMDSRMQKVIELLGLEMGDACVIGIWGMGGIGKTTISRAVYECLSYQFQGCSFIENVREVLLMLDDVDESTDLEKLVEQLREDEAIELFVLKAFGKHQQMGGYEELVHRAVKYAKGVPLALKVLGSFLCGRNKDEWESSLSRLKKSPLKEVRQVLRISYDALDWEEKEIFLDIACFFKGNDKKDVTKILESCGFHAFIGINVLVEKSLVTVSYNKLLMHDLIQELGQYIVWEQSRKEPGKRTRLWLDEDIKRVLMDNTETNKVEGIFMQYSDLRGLDQLKLRPKAFAKMSNLRILKICCTQLSEELKYLSNKLSYLDWLGYPMKYMPSTFQPEHLVELHLTHSSIEQLWEGTMHLGKLRIMNLSHSTSLTKSPDFTGVPNLERLILEGCTGLINLHPSIGILKRLICLNLKDYKNLKSLPHGIQLESLEVFIVSRCSKLDKVLVSLEDMRCLSKLRLDGTGISELPPSIGHLTNLYFISLRDCKNLRSIPDSICQLKDLRFFILSSCSKLDKLPQDLGGLDRLFELRADWTAIRQLPSSIGLLKKLGIITLRGCKGISSNSWSSLFLPSFNSWSSFFLPSVLRRERDNSMASGLEALSGLKSLFELDLSYCNLKSIPTAIGHIYSLEELNLSGNNMESLPASMNQLLRLSKLYLNGCKKLQELPEISSEIQKLRVANCPSLRIIRSPSKCNNFAELSFKNCFKLVENKQNNRLIEKILSNQFQGYFNIVHPGREIPKWFRHQSRGSSVSFRLPPHWFNERFLGFAFAHVGFKKGKSDYWSWCIDISFKCHVTRGIIRRKGPITAPVNFGNLVVMGFPRGAFRRIMEDRLEQSNEGEIEFNVSFEKASRFSYRDDETGEREFYYVFESGVVENVGVHVVYKEAEEQALTSIYYNSEEDDQEDHLNNLNSKRLSIYRVERAPSLRIGFADHIRWAASSSEEEVKERARKAAAASQRWREYSRRGASKPPTFKLQGCVKQ